MGVRGTQRATQDNDSKNSIPTTAQVVIIGGGVIGCSVAYHFAKRGWRDVVLLEKHKLTSGTTWHAAGLIATSGFTTETGVELAKYTRDLYMNLEAETGYATGFNPVGLLQVAANEGVLEDLRRKATFNKYMGVESEEISPTEVKAMWPLARTDDILAGFFAANDGRANPVDVTVALSKGAKAGGVAICEGVEVTGVTQKNGRVTGVTTSEGAIQAEYVVNCAGMWGREIGLMAGVTVPLQSAEHYYIILEGIDGIHRDLPVLEDPEVYGYFREEGGGMMVGLFEPVGAPWALDGIPKRFEFGELDPDMAVFQILDVQQDVQHGAHRLNCAGHLIADRLPLRVSIAALQSGRIETERLQGLTHIVIGRDQKSRFRIVGLLGGVPCQKQGGLCGMRLAQEFVAAVNFPGQNHDQQRAAEQHARERPSDLPIGGPVTIQPHGPGRAV